MDGQTSDRRHNMDRRSTDDRRRTHDRRSGADRRDGGVELVQVGAILRVPGMLPLVERRSGLDRRGGGDIRLSLDRRSGIDRRIGAGWRASDLGHRLTPEHALELVSDFYSASLDARFWPTALAKLRDTLDAGAVALVSHDLASTAGSLTHAVGIDVGEMQAYADIYARNHPWLQLDRTVWTAGAVYRDEDLVAPDDSGESEFVRHWLEPQGYSHQLFAVLERQGQRLLLLYAVRSRSAGGFSDGDVVLVRRLVPYLQRGLRAGLLLERSNALKQAAHEALDALPVGVLIVGAGGSVLAANQVGREVMASREVFALGRGGLELVRDGRTILVRDLIADVGRHAGGNRPAGTLSFSVARASGHRPIAVSLCPVSDCGNAGSHEEPAAIIFIGDPDRAGEVDEPRLRQLYGLTNAEARVAALLARGHRLDEIAEMLGVAYETTRKHLKKVLSKIETDRQADLVRTIVTGPGGLRR